MARAQWSPRVWEPMTKRGPEPPSCQGTAERFPGMTLPCPGSSLRGRGTMWGDAAGTPRSLGHPSRVVVSLQPAQVFCCTWRKTAWHPAGMLRVQGKGDKTGKGWGTDLSFCLGGPRAGQAAHRELLWGEVSRALENGMVGVAHLGFERYISLYSSESYLEILITNESTILKYLKHLPPQIKPALFSPDALRIILVGYVVLSQKYIWFSLKS